MGQLEIARKLNSHLELHDPFTEECQAVYIMVEIRKFLDQNDDRGAAFELLRFYCDWTMHTRKDRRLEHIGPMVKKIYECIRTQIETGRTSEIPPVIGFLQMEDLRADMARFFDAHRIDSRLVAKNDAWLSFVRLLAGVLADQPISHPTREITELCFLPSNNGNVAGRAVFTRPIEGPDKNVHHSYTFGETT